jgi:hypothetical protein
MVQPMNGGSGPRVARWSRQHTASLPAQQQVDARHPSPTSTRCRASVDHLGRCANRRYAVSGSSPSVSPLWRCRTDLVLLVLRLHPHPPTPTHPPTGEDGSPATIIDLERFHR